jgi:hypothetical protein
MRAAAIAMPTIASPPRGSFTRRQQPVAGAFGAINLQMS